MIERIVAVAMLATALPAAAQAPSTAGIADAIHLAASPRIRFAHVLLRTGVRIRYAEQGDSSGDAVILLHGLGDSWYSFSRILPHLPSSLHVFALDQRGHGDSEKPATGFTMADFADDVIAFLDAMGIDRATIVGHSMGSFVAQRVALNAPDRVSSLVLVGSATTARNEVLLGLGTELAGLSDPLPDEFVREFQYGTVHVALPDSFMRRVVAETHKVPLRAFRGSLDGLIASAHGSRLDAIATPVLIVWGDRDALFARDEQIALQRSIRNSTLTVYSEIGHAVHWEAPDRFARDVVSFLGRTRHPD